VSESAELHVSFVDAVRLVCLGDNHWHLKSANIDYVFDDLPLPTATVLEALTGHGAPESQLHALARIDDSEALFMSHLRLMFQLTAAGILKYTVYEGGEPLADFRWLTDGTALDADRVHHNQAFCLSRFACLRKDAARLVVECPLGRAQVRLLDGRAVSAVAILAQPASAAILAQSISGLSPNAALGLLNILSNAEAVVPIDNVATAPLEATAPLGWWEYHDLLFHTRSRRGRHDHPYGGTFVYRNVAPPPALVKPMSEGARVQLPKPDLELLKSTDEAFTSVLERRRSSANSSLGARGFRPSFRRRPVTWTTATVHIRAAARSTNSRSIQSPHDARALNAAYSTIIRLSTVFRR
jgi:hypothetical protein